ncbi:MAG: class I SAM-dependent rRNA methyltransferase [Alphaproteobacteria bacterium]|nr:class I SAM-dependent rRNA methyltransferase [Alphaproteobacteria bacterium]
MADTAAITAAPADPVETDDPALRPIVSLQPGGHRRAASGHPWIYSNEIAMDPAAKALPPGTLVTLRRSDERPLGVAMFNPRTLLAARLLDRDAARPIGKRFFVRHLERALRLRERLYPTPYYRLVHAEADGLPGLVIDRFGALVVVQANAAGMDRLMPLVIDVLHHVLSPEAIVLRNDSPARALEGLSPETRVAAGQIGRPIIVEENGVVFEADVLAGQKTGWFYDQRDNRAFIAGLASGARVLDLYCYSGAFSVAAACAGAAAVRGIDRSEPALALAEAAAHRNGVAEQCVFRRGEVFAEATSLAGAGERFDVVVADPPPFARSKRDVPAALRGYRKLARLAAQLTAPGGILFLASCSYNVAAGDFAEAARRGLADAGRGGRILRSAGAGPDHPVHPALPETAYLKALTLALD